MILLAALLAPTQGTFNAMIYFSRSAHISSGECQLSQQGQRRRSSFWRVIHGEDELQCNDEVLEVGHKSVHSHLDLPCEDKKGPAVGSRQDRTAEDVLELRSREVSSTDGPSACQTPKNLKVCSLDISEYKEDATEAPSQESGYPCV